MRVILINNNPIISRLVERSMQKLNYAFVEYDNTSSLEECDLIIIDSSVEVSVDECKNFAKELLFIIDKNTSIDGYKYIFKPFLPTDFVSLVQDMLEPKEETDNKAAQEDIKEEITNLDESNEE
ncbi:hypothetical protein AVCANL283_04215, partial [Campylobacter canadensis]|nr:hypothetical protein [Campylobacter canadensis]MBZ7998515.1 hypothetical protein [Campylobacter canadensis]